jgi:hypothetical protein
MNIMPTHIGITIKYGQQELFLNSSIGKGIKMEIQIRNVK